MQATSYTIFFLNMSLVSLSGESGTSTLLDGLDGNEQGFEICGLA